ncbi:hypothetical protein KSP39_PZI007394 [Platanthera zijinensis]|uniref:HMA domain-containing protein n=1 Tax=Platanthera zijinensis TaxID=2320716 RepID=A0AAP0GAB4_9ASPA
MSKEDDIKFLKIQTCVLKVNIHCDGCKQKVKKLLQKVDGVFQTSIDAEQGRVTVSGDVDPAELVKKLNKAGKYAEVLHQKGANNNAQLQKAQQNNPKAQQQNNKDCGKTPKGGGGAIVGGGGGKAQKGQQTSFPQLQQMKGFKDLKLPQLKDLKLPFHKDPKSVKFTLPPEGGGDEGSDYDDFDDDDDDDFDDDDLDEFDSFDADFDDDFRNLKLKPGSAQPNAGSGIPMMPDNKNGKKGGGVEIPVQIKGMNGNNDPKNGKKGAGNQSQGGGGKNAGKAGGGGGAAQDTKNAGSNGNPKPNGNISKKGGGGGGKNEAVSAAATVGAPFRPPANFQPGMNVGQMGLMPPSGHPSVAVQGLPAGMAPQGYYPGGGMPAMTPEMMASAAAATGGGPGNPYQQQYMAALMQQQQQQQQQRMMMMNSQDRGYPPMMGYPRPPPPAMYVPQAQPYGEPYTNYFSDENANSCSIM